MGGGATAYMGGCQCLSGGGGWSKLDHNALCGSILQVETCQILSLAENTRCSQVWHSSAQPSLLPHSAPSWILSKSENLASSSLQDGATKCLYYQTEPAGRPPGHPTIWMLDWLGSWNLLGWGHRTTFTEKA